MASLNYFDTSKKNLARFSKWKSVNEMHVITQFANCHGYSCFSYMDN